MGHVISGLLVCGVTSSGGVTWSVASRGIV